MIVSVLLRLIPEALADGRLVGRMELVDTGERRVVRSVDELVAFLREQAIADQSDPEKEQ